MYILTCAHLIFALKTSCYVILITYITSADRSACISGMTVHSLSDPVLWLESIDLWLAVLPCATFVRLLLTGFSSDVIWVIMKQRLFATLCKMMQFIMAMEPLTCEGQLGLNILQHLPVFDIYLSICVMSVCREKVILDFAPKRYIKHIKAALLTAYTVQHSFFEWKC